MNKRFLALGLTALALAGGFLCAQAEENGFLDKVTLSVEFNGSLISADSEGVVDSMADAGFNEDETKLGVGYESELWGIVASLKFNNESLRILMAEAADLLGTSPLSIDELYAWIKPFGESFKFTGGIFENTDGVAGYRDDIDDFDIGVFVLGEDGAAFTEPVENTNAALVSGFLVGAAFGSVTVQLHLAQNYSKESGSDVVNGFFSAAAGGTFPPVENEDRFFRIGGRIIAELETVTISAMFKTLQMPMIIVNTMTQMETPSAPVHGGTKQNYSTFGAYVDLTAVENLGVSLGYTGFLTATDESGVDSNLWNGIDIRAAWTGIEGLSVSTHNNVSFAKGSAGDLMGLDGDFFNLYNAVGVTKELTDSLSLNVQAGNIFSRTDISAGKFEQDTVWVEPKVTAKVGENAEFSAGLRLDITKTAQSGIFGDADDMLTTFSVPVVIAVSL
jgi:hypothetical protein